MTTKKKELNLKLKTPRIVIAEVNRQWDKTPFRNGEHLLLLGEIQNMRGHVIVVNAQGVIHWGYHPDNFREALENEI